MAGRSVEIFGANNPPYFAVFPREQYNLVPEGPFVTVDEPMPTDGRLFTWGSLLAPWTIWVLTTT